eukprot:8892822-Heterocapsa_arctica.AAC.1
MSSTLKQEAEALINKVNIECNQKFGNEIGMEIKACDLDQVVAMVFNDEEQATKFLDLYKDAKYVWKDPLNGDKELRVMRDSSFDERMKRQ